MVLFAFSFRSWSGEGGGFLEPGAGGADHGRADGRVMRGVLIDT